MNELAADMSGALALVLTPKGDSVQVGAILIKGSKHISAVNPDNGVYMHALAMWVFLVGPKAWEYTENKQLPPKVRDMIRACEPYMAR